MLSLACHQALAGGGAAADAGAYARGAMVYERCAACHALETDRTGPRHCGLIGRRAGSIPGFAYSPTMRQSKIIWSAANLDRFLKAPLAMVPGTAMGYDGIKDERERRDLIAYLRAARQEARCRPASFGGPVGGHSGRHTGIASQGMQSASRTLSDGETAARAGKRRILPKLEALPQIF
ncbi:MAG: c-type cytochrome [Sulfuritalea sp.]|nr:c-type cytochrome [Sulfuritalea sp.]